MRSAGIENSDSESGQSTVFRRIFRGYDPVILVFTPSLEIPESCGALCLPVLGNTLALRLSTRPHRIIAASPERRSILDSDGTSLEYQVAVTLRVSQDYLLL